MVTDVHTCGERSDVRSHKTTFSHIKVIRLKGFSNALCTHVALMISVSLCVNVFSGFSEWRRESESIITTLSLNEDCTNRYTNEVYCNTSFNEDCTNRMTETTRNDNLTITSGDSDVDIQLPNIVRSKSEPGDVCVPIRLRNSGGWPVLTSTPASPVADHCVRLASDWTRHQPPRLRPSCQAGTINTDVYFKSISFLPARFTLMYGFSDLEKYERSKPLGKIVQVSEATEKYASAGLVTRAVSPVG
ncbi:hypothetical protein E5288_WYG006733 [Bos mutus]|uniref:Uncharacterized protein n=1 Tax=Bos mutus TaxID=72004 RepID=A0A6B0RGI0_9CETA|nr:hypothetical protein [Bos mutus]